MSGRTLKNGSPADRVDVLLVGVPRRLDDGTSEIIEKIEAFIKELKQRSKHTRVRRRRSLLN